MKIFVIRRQWWTTAGCLCIAAAMFWVVSHPAAIGAAGAARQLPIYCVQVPEEEEKKVAISFDAAWGDVILRHFQKFIKGKASESASNFWPVMLIDKSTLADHSCKGRFFVI